MKFISAKPVWPAGREREMNLFVGFATRVNTRRARRVTLRLTASCVYRVFVNGVMAGSGPARGPHGWYRVDEWDLTDRCNDGACVIAIEVAGYNANSFYVLDQPSFLQAEVEADGRILAATGDRGFAARILEYRLQKVQRYTYQRTFSEVYRMRPDSEAWRAGAIPAAQRCRCAVHAAVPLLQRGVALPDLGVRQPVAVTGAGTLVKKPLALDPYDVLNLQWKQNKTFAKDGMDTQPSLEVYALHIKSVKRKPGPYDRDETVSLRAHEFITFDFGVNLCGFPGARLTCRKKMRVALHFSELLIDGDVKHRDADGANLVVYELEPGTYDVESFEPYGLRYLKFIVLDGACQVAAPSLRLFVNADVHTAQFACSDPRMNLIFEAGRETFRQNALDIFMDCPSRERAGWLCDSFFTARAALSLSGNTKVERNFYENFLLPAAFPNHPKGMLPMCYPSDHTAFLPNWAMWFIVELEEYLQRSGDRALVDGLKKKVYDLFRYFLKFMNSDGLLEKLDGWVFVEWSKANDFVQDVNYPTNMLYAGALDAAARIYGDRRLAKQAAAMRRTIRKQSFDGKFFVDNALRKEDGRLEVTRNRTETCQYYAFFFDVATPALHPSLFRTMCRRFGPTRDLEKTFAEVWPSNAFIGVMLRLEILARHGKAPQMLEESVPYWLPMAERTGTLWEHLQPSASCSHGFTSHVTHAFFRDVVGLHKVDPVNRTVLVHFNDLPLAWADGTMPVPDGLIELRWRREKNTIHYECRVPAGYRVKVQADKGVHCERSSG